jgi:hypothetical protein
MQGLWQNQNDIQRTSATNCGLSGLLDAKTKATRFEEPAIPVARNRANGKTADFTSLKAALLSRHL